MSFQMFICIALFVFMLVNFLLAKLPLGVIASITAVLLVITGCTKASTILTSIGSANTVTIACMVILASGLSCTSFPSRLTSGIRKATNGNYRLAYLGVIIIAIALTSMLTSPMASYAIVFPIMNSVCDEFGVNRSKAQFPLVVTCLACCAIVPLGFAISQSAVFAGYMETYGFTQSFTAMDFFKGRWPFIFIVLAWAYFIAPKLTPEHSVAAAVDENKKSEIRQLNKFSDIAGVIIFAIVILGFIFNKRLGGIPTWYISFAGVMAMIVCGTLSKNEAIKAIPVDICMLFVGANAMATALVGTGTADFIGSLISGIVGNSKNTFVLHAVFFIVPFLTTQFMQNQSVMNVFAPIALITCSALGGDPRGCLILISSGALTAYMTPSATAAIPMCMSAGGYNVKELLKMGWLFALILCICYVAFVSVVFPAF